MTLPHHHSESTNPTRTVPSPHTPSQPLTTTSTWVSSSAPNSNGEHTSSKSSPAHLGGYINSGESPKPLEDSHPVKPTSSTTLLQCLLLPTPLISGTPPPIQACTQQKHQRINWGHQAATIDSRKSSKTYNWRP